VEQQGFILNDESLKWKKMGPSKRFTKDDEGCIIKYKRIYPHEFGFAILEEDRINLRMIMKDESGNLKTFGGKRYWYGKMRNKKYSFYILSREDSMVIRLMFGI
jgi:hypothetical protein